MRLRGIRIRGMHNTSDRSFDFGDFTYLVGPNGAGKTTVLNAIQFGILGYVPGTGQTKAAIDAHTCGDMSIQLDFDSSSITRSVTHKKSTVAITGYDTNTGQEIQIDADRIIGNLKLPVFDFSKFSSMSANDLKRWFADFLPESTFTISWKSELVSVLINNNLKLGDYTILDDLVQYADSCSDSVLEQAKCLNDEIKTRVSAKNAEIARLQSTIQSLVYYDELDSDSSDPDELGKQLSECRAKAAELTAQVRAIESAKSEYKRLTEYIESCGIQTDLTDYENSQAYLAEVEAVKACTEDLIYHQTKIQELDTQLSELKYALGDCERRIHSSGVCPYTNKVCDDLSGIIEDSTHMRDSLMDEIAQVKAMRADACKLKDSASDMLDRHKSRLLSFTTLYKATIPRLNEIRPLATADADAIRSDITDLSAKADDLNAQAIRAEANRRYDELSDRLASDKFTAEQELAALNAWKKYTDVNGIQTEIMDKPFITFANAVSKTLSRLYGYDVQFKFNLDTKANSFGFGVVRDDAYIGYDYLSSGERCLVALALLISITVESNAPLKLMLVDDMLDHLDPNRSGCCLDALNKICHDNEIQIIAAGVAIPNSGEYPGLDDYTVRIGDVI